jgi:cobalt/nickel transport system permease protein
VLVISTTEISHILHGLGRLRFPRVIVSIAGFMMRYLDVIAGEMSRMRIAMVARGYSPRWMGEIRGLGMAGGALFSRSYERGERVYQAMSARGYAGVMPAPLTSSPSALDWSMGMAIPVSAWIVTITAVLS